MAQINSTQKRASSIKIIKKKSAPGLVIPLSGPRNYIHPQRLFSFMFMNLIFMFPCIMTQYTKMTNKMQLCRIIYYSLAALHVSSDIFTHLQDHLKCITASGITHVCRCRLVSVPTLP